MQLQILLGDVAIQKADVIVSSLSPDVSGTSGVERAIAMRGGEAVLQSCRGLIAASGCDPTVGTVLSSATGALSARWLLHVRGPDYGVDAGADLARTYQNVFRRAVSLGATSIALPSISTGRRAFPNLEAAQVAVRAARGGPFGLRHVRFVLSNRSLYRTFVNAFLLET